MAEYTPYWLQWRKGESMSGMRGVKLFAYKQAERLGGPTVFWQVRELAFALEVPASMADKVEIPAAVCPARTRWRSKEHTSRDRRRTPRGRAKMTIETQVIVRASADASALLSFNLSEGCQ